MRVSLMLIVLLMVGCAGADLSAKKDSGISAKPSVQMDNKTNVSL